MITQTTPAGIRIGPIAGPSVNTGLKTEAFNPQPLFQGQQLALQSIIQKENIAAEREQERLAFIKEQSAAMKATLAGGGKAELIPGSGIEVDPFTEKGRNALNKTREYQRLLQENVYKEMARATDGTGRLDRVAATRNISLFENEYQKRLTNDPEIIEASLIYRDKQNFAAKLAAAEKEKGIFIDYDKVMAATQGMDDYLNDTTGEAQYDRSLLALQNYTYDEAKMEAQAAALITDAVGETEFAEVVNASEYGANESDGFLSVKGSIQNEKKVALEIMNKRVQNDPQLTAFIRAKYKMSPAQFFENQIEALLRADGKAKVEQSITGVESVNTTARTRASNAAAQTRKETVQNYGIAGDTEGERELRGIAENLYNRGYNKLFDRSQLSSLMETMKAENKKRIEAGLPPLTTQNIEVDATTGEGVLRAPKENADDPGRIIVSVGAPAGQTLASKAPKSWIDTEGGTTNDQYLKGIARNLTSIDPQFLAERDQIERALEFVETLRKSGRDVSEQNIRTDGTGQVVVRELNADGSVGAVLGEFGQASANPNYSTQGSKFNLQGLEGLNNYANLPTGVVENFQIPPANQRPPGRQSASWYTNNPLNIKAKSGSGLSLHPSFDRNQSGNFDGMYHVIYPTMEEGMKAGGEWIINKFKPNGSFWASPSMTLFDFYAGKNNPGGARFAEAGNMGHVNMIAETLGVSPDMTMGDIIATKTPEEIALAFMRVESPEIYKSVSAGYTGNAQMAINGIDPTQTAPVSERTIATPESPHITNKGTKTTEQKELQASVEEFVLSLPEGAIENSDRLSPQTKAMVAEFKELKEKLPTVPRSERKPIQDRISNINKILDDPEVHRAYVASSITNEESQAAFMSVLESQLANVQKGEVVTYGLEQERWYTGPGKTGEDRKKIASVVFKIGQDDDGYFAEYKENGEFKTIESDNLAGVVRAINDAIPNIYYPSDITDRALDMKLKGMGMTMERNQGGGFGFTVPSGQGDNQRVTISNIDEVANAIKNIIKSPYSPERIKATLEGQVNPSIQRDIDQFFATLSPQNKLRAEAVIRGDNTVGIPVQAPPPPPPAAPTKADSKIEQLRAQKTQEAR